MATRSFSSLFRLVFSFYLVDKSCFVSIYPKIVFFSNAGINKDLALDSFKEELDAALPASDDEKHDEELLIALTLKN